MRPNEPCTAGEVIAQLQESVAKKVPMIVLKKRNDSLESIRENIRMARKPRLRTVKQYLCDSCDRVIDKPSEGFIVHGNIYVADPSCRGGLVGDNFPSLEDEKQTLTLDQIKKTVLCKVCFLKALGLIERSANTRSNVAADVERMMTGMDGTSIPVSDR